MKVAVLGSGNIGGTLGRQWALAGHEIRFGVRDPRAKQEQLADLAGKDQISVHSVASACEGVAALLLAVPAGAVDLVMRQIAGQIQGTTIIDSTNDFSRIPMGALDTIRTVAPEASVYRAFNTLGWENFKDPTFDDLNADLLYCGKDEAQARDRVESLIRAAELRPVWIGSLDQQEVLDGLTRLWATLAIRCGRGRHLAFKVLMDQDS